MGAAEITALLKATVVRTRKQKFIVEGFPRTAEEKAAFERDVGQIQLWAQLDNPKVCGAFSPPSCLFLMASGVT